MKDGKRRRCDTCFGVIPPRIEYCHRTILAKAAESVIAMLTDLFEAEVELSGKMPWDPYLRWQTNQDGTLTIHLCLGCYLKQQLNGHGPGYEH